MRLRSDKFRSWVRGGGQVVSVLGFYSNDLSSNPAVFSVGLAYQKTMSGLQTENTNLICKGELHLTADLLFGRFVTSDWLTLELTKDLLAYLNPNQLNRTSINHTESKY